MVGWLQNTDLSQKQISDFHPEWARRKIMEEGIPATLNRGNWQGETVLKHNDGHEIPVFQTILVHYDDQGRPSYLSTIIRDITKQKADEHALIAAKEAAEAATCPKVPFWPT